MSRIALLLALLTAVTPAAWAQPTSETCSYESCALRLTANFFGERLVRGATSEEAVKINLTGSNAANLLSRVESAAAPARSFKSRRTRGAILGLIGGGLVGWVAAKAWHSDGSGFEATWTPADQTLFWVGVGTGVWSGIEVARSRNDLSRAIWEFNRSPVR